MTSPPLNYDIRISFTIFSPVTLSPEEIEGILGLQANSKGRFGAKSPAHRQVPAKNWTTFRSWAGEEDAPFEEHWDDLSKKLLPKEAELKKLTDQCELIFGVLAEDEDGIHPFKISTEVIEFCATIGAIIEVKAY